MGFDLLSCPNTNDTEGVLLNYVFLLSRNPAYLNKLNIIKPQRL